MINGPHHLESVAAYRPGASAEQIRKEYGLTNVEKLASNENPFGASPIALAAASEALRTAHLYADGGAALRERLAIHHRRNVDQISVNNGSDAIIHQVMRTFLADGGTALSAHGGFVSFGIAVRSLGIEPQYVDLDADHRFDVEALTRAITSDTKIIYIPNPNNPTGTYITKDELSWFLEQVPDDRLVVLDEAYHEYGRFLAPETYPDAIELEHPNVLSLRTFSKAYGLAALRIGYAVGHADVVKWLLKTKLPFDPNGIACAAAAAALDDEDHVRKTVETNAAGLALLSSTLREEGYTTTSSIANFVMVDCGDVEQARAFHRALLEHGFIARPLTGFDLPTCVRISTGTPDQNLRLAATLKELAATFVTV